MTLGGGFVPVRERAPPRIANRTTVMRGITGSPPQQSSMLLLVRDGLEKGGLFYRGLLGFFIYLFIYLRWCPSGCGLS